MSANIFPYPLFSGEDISVCVCLAILTSLFDDGGMLSSSCKKFLPIRFEFDEFYYWFNLFVAWESFVG